MSNKEISNITINNINYSIKDTEARNNIVDLKNKTNALVNGSPLVANSTSEMTDTKRTYVNLTDGQWYYYNGTEWTPGGTYQAEKVADGSITYTKLENYLKELFKEKLEDVDISFDIAGFYYTNGNLDTAGGWHTAKHEVNSGERYYVRGEHLGNARLVLMLDENSTPLGVDYAIPSSSTTAWEKTETIFTIPENCKYLYILQGTGRDTTILKKVVGYTLQELSEIQGKLFVENMCKPFKYWSLWNSGVDKTENEDGSLTLLNKGTTTKYGGIEFTFTNDMFEILDKPYKFIIDTLAVSGTWKGVVYLRDSEGTMIRNIQKDISNGKIEFEFTPTLECATYQFILFSTTESAEITVNDIYLLDSIYNVEEIGNSALEYIYKLENEINKIKLDEFDIKEAKKRIIENQLKNDFKWSKDINTTKMAVFTFDDSLADISTIETLFESKGVPCCFATIPSKLNDLCTSGETVQEVLERAITNGGEVLSHWGGCLTSASEDEDYKNIYINAKKQLENAGFEVNGIITAGGTDYQTQDFAKCTELARIYYQYADLTATHKSSIEQFYNRRFFLDGGYNSVKTYIDNFLSGTKGAYSKWMNFASHGTKDTSIEVIEQIIDYCISQGITITTWKNVYETYKSSQLEERIKLLEV